MPVYRYLTDVSHPTHLAGKKDAKRDLPADQAQHMLAAGMIELVPTPAPEPESITSDVEQSVPTPEPEPIKPVRGSEVTTPPSEATE